VESSWDVHTDLPQKVGRTPRSHLPHMQLEDVRTGLHLDFNARTFLQCVDALLAARRSPKPEAPRTFV